MNDEANKKIAEVVEASSTAFTAQCYELYSAPPLGAFVRAGKPAAYAVVCDVVTQGLDPGRRVIPRGQDEEEEEAIYQTNPQLTRLLSTTFQAQIVGHQDGERPRHYLPALPPRIHTFVYPCTPREVALFTESFDFVRLLLQGTPSAADEVVAACLRLASQHHVDRQRFLLRSGKVLAAELVGELGRLNAILRRMRP